MNENFLLLKNGEAAPLGTLPVWESDAFFAAQIEAVNQKGRRVEAFFVQTLGEENLLISILGDPGLHQFEISATRIGRSYPSLTLQAPAFQWFEREIAEQTKIVPKGHPWLKPIRFIKGDPGVTDYFTLRGDAAHEVAVGPVHAGVIEPGHFRFQCMGEDVYSLEISLGYQHRGIEKMLENGPDCRTIHLLETAAGDTTVASGCNYSRIVEALSPASLLPQSETLRMIAMELERIANHVGDLGALSGDVAFLPTASFCGRIRGEYLNMTAELCGNRFGRGLVAPGGTRYALEPERAKKIADWIDRVYPELQNALVQMFDSPTVLDRFENTGTIPLEMAQSIGLVGVPGRASGLQIDARHDFPYAGYGLVLPPRANGGAGDVFARASVRRQELAASHTWLLRTLREMTEAIPAVDVQPGRLAADSIAISVVEAWRGELCHVALTGHDGRFLRYKVVDPSFHNWFGLAMALRGEQISNFPICNKSFNLSYCGHDL